MEAKTRATQILDAFVEFHMANPRIWRLFEKFAFEAIDTGRDHYSSDAICHRIRWYTDIETRSSVKINNNFTAYYARLFGVRHPAHAGFFRNRVRTSAERDSYDDDLQVFVAPAAGEEADVKARLANLELEMV